jgi:hypothetical protein
MAGDGDGWGWGVAEVGDSLETGCGLAGTGWGGLR